MRAQSKVPHRRLGEAAQRKAANYTGFVFNFSKAKVREDDAHSQHICKNTNVRIHIFIHIRITCRM